MKRKATSLEQPTPETFGTSLRGLRQESNLTLTQLSKLSGISQPYLSQLENGKSGLPSPEILKKIADAMEPHIIRYSGLLSLAGHFELAHAVQQQEIIETFGDWDNEKELISLSEQVRFLEGITDLKTFLQRKVSPYPTYNGHRLSDQDRQRILAMLEVLFPEYSSKE